MNLLNQTYPDPKGHFGIYGGRYVAETLMPALLELESAYQKIAHSPEFQDEFSKLSNIEPFKELTEFVLEIDC